jgi:hypothetical protein
MAAKSDLKSIPVLRRTPTDHLEAVEALLI